MENAIEETGAMIEPEHKKSSILKNVLMVLGSIFGIIIILVIILLIYSATVGTKLDKSSKAYVDSEVPKILSTWNANELNADASLEFIQVATSSQDQVLMTHFSKDLGALKTYNGSEGESGIHFDNGVKTITAEYTASSTFQKGNANIFIQLIQQSGEWKIRVFHVDEVIPTT